MIQRDTLYRVSEVMKLLDLTEHAVRRAKREGLPTILHSGHYYIFGNDLYNYFEKLKQEQHGTEDEITTRYKFQEIKEKMAELSEKTRIINEENRQ